MTRSRTTKQDNTNGSTATDIVLRSILPTPQPTKRFAPTGGVINPIARLTIITTPKCTRLMSNANATGIKSGVKIKSADVESRKHPATSRMRLTIRRKMMTFPPERSI